MNYPTGLKELEFVMRRDCDCDRLDETFGVCVHHERMFSLLSVFCRNCGKYRVPHISPR